MRSNDPEMNAALEADAAKLMALGADPGPTMEELGLPTDPTPTPTPREVLARYLNEVPDGVTVLADSQFVESMEIEVLAALAATGDAPLSEERLAELRGIFESSKSIIDEKCGLELLTAYTTLAAQLAAVRAERDALREQLDGDGVVRGEDAAAIVREINNGTPDTPSRVKRIREADRIFAENQRLFAENHRLRHPPISAPHAATPTRPTDTGRDG